MQIRRLNISLFSSQKLIASIIVGTMLTFANLASAADQSELKSNESIKYVERITKKSGAPSGLMGAKWFQSPTQVKKNRPNIIPGKPGEYKEIAIYNGRQAIISYFFINNKLLIISVGFSDASLVSYEATQKKLLSDFGPMSKPQPDSTYSLISDRFWSLGDLGNARLDHALLTTNGAQYELIGLYLTTE